MSRSPPARSSACSGVGVAAGAAHSWGSGRHPGGWLLQPLQRAGQGGSSGAGGGGRLRCCGMVSMQPRARAFCRGVGGGGGVGVTGVGQCSNRQTPGVSSRARASPPSPLVAHIDTLDLVLTSPAVRVRRQHWPRHCLRQDVPVRRAQRHRPGRQRYLEVDEPGGLEEKGSPCLLVQAPQCFGCYIQTVYRSYWALTERSPLCLSTMVEGERRVRGRRELGRDVDYTYNL